MYNISYFKENDPAVVIGFMKENPFVTLCGCDVDSKPVATHVPVLFSERDGKLFLQAHIMRKQDHTVAFEQNQNVLAIFHGPHTYVSASWYEDKHSGSTWNYMVAHARGTMRFMDEKALYDLLTRLTDKFENNPHSPSLVKHLSDEYVTGMMKAIVAFEIEVTSIENVFKLSQNRNEKSYQNIINELEKRDGDNKVIADIMKKRESGLFDNDRD